MPAPDKLVQLCKEHNICVLAVGGADGAHDASSRLLLRLFFNDLPGLQEDGILFVTAAAIHLHCTDAAWATSGPLSDCAAPVHVYCASCHVEPGSDEAVAFKLAAAQRMLSRAGGSPVIAGTQPAAAGPLSAWPLLRALGADVSIPTGAAKAGLAVQQFLFSCSGGSDLTLASGRLASRWDEMLRVADRFAEDENISALNEAALEPLLSGDGGAGSCVRVGTRTAAVLTDDDATKASKRAAQS